MNTIETLNRYLKAAESRLKMFALSRGASLTALVALALTIILAWFANAFQFAPAIVFVSRVLLFVALALALTFGGILPLLRLNRRNAARRLEQRYPEFQQRLLTFAERREAGNPFLALLATETAEVAQRVESSAVAPRRNLLTWLASGAGAAALLVWLILAGPGYLGYGASLLWAGPPRPGTPSLYNIVVTPGDRTVRRRADQLITAQLIGFETRQVHLQAKFGPSTKWEEVSMQPQPGAGTYEFLFAALPDSVEYYVEAGGIRSKTHKLSVIDLPGIKSFRVTYHYPAWSGLKDATEDPGGDLRAVEGTTAELTVQTTAPIRTAVVALDDDKTIQLAGQGTTLKADVPIQKDGMYHFAALDRDQGVRLSEDYFIEARKDNPPVVKLTRPGRDAKVNPIEEVPLAVEAEDDFGLQDVTLHYAVNGGPERTINVLKSKGAKQSEGKSMLSLEDDKLVPGDIVAVYATARDARTTSKTDMYFIEAQPFERTYSQSQQSGGGGDGDQDQDGRISARQKEIIAATWNELKGKSAQNAADSAANSRFLAEVQAKLRDQARSLSERAKSRALAGVNQEFQSFVKSMDEAVTEMSASADKLKSGSWQPALGPEQRALQNLLRAESVFREIQVAMSRGNSGGKGGAARDLDNLFDLELDTEKNQYETGQQSGSADQRQRDLDEALQKLEQLARRQQELAREQNKPQQSFQQRWEQEQLRREAEELRRKMEQLARGEQGSQQSSNSGESRSSSSSASSSSSSSGQQGSSSQQGRSGQQQQQASNERLRQAFDRLSQATDDMRQSASTGDQSTAGARRAADRLSEAKDLLRGIRQQQSSSQLDDLARRAGELASQQQQFAEKMRRAYHGGSESESRQSGPGSSELQQMAAEKERMGRDLEAVERDTQKAARDLAGSEPAASSKLRQGLGQLQQDEVGTRMKFSANWIRQGRGGYLVAGESVAAADLNKLADAIKDARSAVGKDGGKQGDSEAEKALARVEKMRQQLERATAARNRDRQGAGQQSGQQPGQEPGQQGQRSAQQGGQPGQQGSQAGQSGQQSGQQPGQGGRGEQGSADRAQNGQAEGGENGDRTGGRNRGNLGGPGAVGPDSGGSGGDPDRALREAFRDLNQMRQSLGGNSEIGREINDTMRDMQRGNSPYALAGPALNERIEKEVLPALEQLELTLRRKVDGDSATIRNAAPDQVPAGYSEKVAEYFRKLSKGK